MLWCVREGAVKQFPPLVMTVKRKRTKTEEERVNRCCYCCEIQSPQGKDRAGQGKEGEAGPGTRTRKGIMCRRMWKYQKGNGG